MAKKSTPESPEDSGLLKNTAVVLGEAAGKVVSLAKAVIPHEHASAQVAPTRGKLPKKHKNRLPRKEKKLMAKRNAGAAV